jgi:hypothetical protein
MKPFRAGLLAIGAMVLTLELLPAMADNPCGPSQSTLTGSMLDMPGITYPTEWHSG